MSSKTQTGAAASPSSQSVIFYLLCAGFVINGIVISLIGPILPMFMAKWGLNDSRAGLFSLVQFSGSFIGVLASSALISAKGFKPAITLGITLLGLGFALLNAPTFVLALAASALYGLGYGFATPGTNLWVGESYGTRRASALSVMNLAWGAGAISSSPLAMLAMRTSHVSLLLNVV
jgi:MFS transporter, FHS family, glucose/mannose:H+ symporter